ncbi:cytochrome P450 [Mycolicibacterium sp.]|uniref:cytochrome P450 n=1 Tax=Mycolicibacterium sp. TaxID=2320850 RepID=UPI0037CC6933
MSSLLLPVDHVKERLCSVVLAPALDVKLRQRSRGWRLKELATVPSASCLKPVPGDPGLAFVGYTLDHIQSGSDFSRDRYERRGWVSWLGALGTNMVVIAAPEATREALTSEAKACSQDGWYFLDAFSHRGLTLTSFGNPSRFEESRREDQQHRFGWAPFGGGVHKCIGMRFGTLEAKAILHRMLRTFRWPLPADYHVRWDNSSLPVPVDGLPLEPRRR